MWTMAGTTALGLRRPRSNDNESVLHISQKRSLTTTCSLMSYSGHFLFWGKGCLTSLQWIQSAYCLPQWQDAISLRVPLMGQIDMSEIINCFLSFRFFRLLSSSLLLYSLRFCPCILRLSSGVSCQTWEPSWNFEPCPLFNQWGSRALIPSTVTGYKC